MREFPLKTCPACGSDWFREADFAAWTPEEQLGSSWPTWPDGVGLIEGTSTRELICLCGRPMRPDITRVRGGTPEFELAQFLESLKNGQAWLKDHHDGDSVLAAAEEGLAKPESLRILAARLPSLERQAGPGIARQNPSRKSPRGRYWESPERKPTANRVVTVETLVIALEKKGLTARQAKRVVKAIFESIVNWLKDGGTAQTPLGVFEVVFGPRPRKLLRLGKRRMFYTKPKRVRFRASRELRYACNRSIKRETAVPNQNRKSIPAARRQCEKCGSSHFVEGIFKQHMAQYEGSSTTENPVNALVCLCGHPVLPGKLRLQALTDHRSFKKSFDAALLYRETTSPEAILRRIAADYASKLQHDELAERIANMENILREPSPPSPRKRSRS